MFIFKTSMKCSFLSTPNNYALSAPNKTKANSSTQSFGGNSPEKLIKYILSAQNFKKVKINFDEAVKIYNHLGYDVLTKSGSHAVVVVGSSNIPLVRPHKGNHLGIMDIKRLRCMISGDIEKAKQI